MADFKTVTACCRALSPRVSELREADRRIVGFWTGS
jgi:hypothetical protein